MGARIFNIQKYSIYDGPGIRTLVFFKGCPLNCLWCANPEGKSHALGAMWNASLCAHCGLCASVCPEGNQAFANGRHSQISSACSGCGKCAEACPARALKQCGKFMEIEELLRIVLEDAIFYQTSGGGMTLGGGEPLAQPEAALALLQAAKACGVNTAMETCGMAKREVVEAMAPFTDLFLYDLKHMDSEKHQRLTGVPNKAILDNLAWLLETGSKVVVRMPLINGCNADMEEMAARARLLQAWVGSENFRGVHLLPYHRLGIHKYGQLGESYGLDDSAIVPEEFLEKALRIFSMAQIPAQVVRH